MGPKQKMMKKQKKLQLSIVHGYEDYMKEDDLRELVQYGEKTC